MPEGSTSPRPLSGERILVVDDQEDVRTYLLAIFADAGASVCEAADGQEAVSVARSFAPDLITLDLSMPGHDGITAFCELRETPATEDIPVCIITGHPEMRALVYERPARPPEGYIAKPFAPERVVSSVRRILDLHRRKVRRQ
jgi:CheY-like chemotaxis protein